MNNGGRFFKKTVRDVHWEGKTVLLRADYNVPLASDGKLADDFRLRASVPTIKYLHSRGARIVIISHMGRPDGKSDPKYSLEPVAERLSELLDHKVVFVADCVGDVAKQAIKKLPPHGIALLENLRFHAQEEADDEAFAKSLAKDSQADYFVQDGFGVVHRAHASTDAITHYLPGVAGLLLVREVMQITRTTNKPARPVVAILGGAKVSDKVEVIERFVTIADHLLIGGAMANNFLQYKGIKVGKSKVEDVEETIGQIYHKAARKVGKEAVNEYLVLPSDVAVAREASASAKRTNVSVQHIDADEMVLDIGDTSIERFVSIIESAKTILWNGTLGLAELPEFAHGSARIALAIAENREAISIVGGGDTADFVLKWSSGKPGFFTHISTGGGASLDLMAGKKLPGVESLLDA